MAVLKYPTGRCYWWVGRNLVFILRATSHNASRVLVELLHTPQYIVLKPLP